MGARSQTFERVEKALRRLVASDEPVTVKAVALRAGMSRSTIYNDPDLLSLIQSYEIARAFDDGFSAGARDGKARRGTTSHLDDDAWARGVLHIAPGDKVTPQLLRQRRAQLSQFLHPDKGGDTSLQQTLNHAFDILKGRAA